MKKHQWVRRRVPKFSVFMVCGGFIGVFCSQVFVLTTPANAHYSLISTLFFFAVWGAMIGIGVGGLCALFFDARSRR